MSTEMNAVETVQLARYRPSPAGDDSALVVPDPLADTPEGDHEFMETMRWADARELGRVCLQRMLEYDYALLGGPDFKAAFLEALAAAIKGEQG